jgi:hypothetical protein
MKEGQEELHAKIHDELAGFYVVLKKADPYIRFSLITGITKFSQLNIFSGLNQLDDITLNKNYASICGITQAELESNFEPEIKQLADSDNLTYEDTLKKLKERYNGYRFSKAEVTVYNPFSTIKVLKVSEFDDYWFSASTPKVLINEISRIKFDVSKFDNEIVASATRVSNYLAGSDDIVPLLLQSGYLTIKSVDYLGDYILGFPNGEVKRGFLNCLISYFASNDGKVDVNGNQLLRDLHDHNLERFFDKLKSIYAGIPHNLHDTSERHFHGLFYIAFAAMDQCILAEKRNSQGSADAIIEIGDYVYIFEFKVSGNGTAQSAIDQINERGYATKYEADPNEKRKIVKLGVVFDKKTKTIGEWKEVGSMAE